MKIFMICSVRDADEDMRADLDYYVKSLEDKGHEVYYPPRDTNQDGRGIDICKANAQAILDCDEVHINYVDRSQGSHFDMGVAWAAGKSIVVVESDPMLPNGKKCYARMLQEWENEGNILFHCATPPTA